PTPRRQVHRYPPERHLRLDFGRGMRSRAEPAWPSPRPPSPRPVSPRPVRLRPPKLPPARLRPAGLRPIQRLPKARRPMDAPPSEPLPSEPLRTELRREKAPREETPRSQPRPGDFGPPDRRRALVSLVSGLPRENRGACPVRPPPARLPRCRNCEARPRDGDRPKTADRVSVEEVLRLNTEPPSRDRPTFAPPNLEMPSWLEPSPAEPSRAEAPRPADREPPSNESPNTPWRRRPPNLTLAVPAPSPAGANAAPRPAGDRWAGRPSLSWGSCRAVGRTAPGPRRPPIEPDPLSRSDSRSLGVFPPASCLIAPWLAPEADVLAWLGDHPARRLSPRAPPRRSAAATAYSTNGHSSTL